MRTTFQLDTSCRPVSAIAPLRIPHALKAGDGVRLSQSFATEYGVIPEGSRGYVTAVDEAEGIVEITMCGQLPALYLWGNKLILVPFETEDLAAVVNVRRTAWSNLRCRVVTAVSAIAATCAFIAGVHLPTLWR